MAFKVLKIDLTLILDKTFVRLKVDLYTQNSGSTISSGEVDVQEGLVFVIIPQDVEVSVGSTATFNCMAKGIPGPTSLLWEFNGDCPPIAVSYYSHFYSAHNV